MPETQDILLEQLQVGLYVHLDLKWFEHPFAFSHFKIKSQEQIHQLRSLGLRKIRIEPALSDVLPAALPFVAGDTAAVTAAANELAAPPPAAAESPELLAKRAMMERMRQLRENAARIEHAFVDTARAMRDMEKNVFAQPAASLQRAGEMIGKIAGSILSAPELAIHVMGDRVGGEEIYLHSLNVTMLAMMIARDIKLPREVAEAMGVGAMFHDLGVRNVPDRVLTKPDALTPSEQHLYETHSAVGADMAQKLNFPPAAMAILRDHHEMFDGSGYPNHLKGEDIGLLARIVAIANYYDRLCNPVNGSAGLTPHEALSLMFAKNRGKFDPKLLQVFIRCLGVYPPGTIVQLSNGSTGMVATINTEKPNKPELVVYEAGVPREDAVMVDMERESDLNIVRAIKPSQVPKDIYAYLSPRKRVSYYFDATKPGQGSRQLISELRQLMLDHSPHMMLLVDPGDLRIIVANKVAEQVLGYSAAQLTEMLITDIESSLQDVFYWEDVRGGRFQDIDAQEGEYQRADGSQILVMKSLRVLRHEERWLILILARDARQERKVEDVLEQTLSQLRTTLEATGNGILVIDWHNKIASMNRQFSAMWHIPEAFLKSGNDAAILEFLTANVQEQELCRARLQQVSDPLETLDRLHLHDGRVFECRSRPQFLGERIIGRVYGFMETTERDHAEQMLRESRDQLENRVHERTLALQMANITLESEKSRQAELIRKLGETQNQLLQSEKMASIGVLAAGVAHEINNPVGFVNSNLSSLERYLQSLLQLLDAYEAREAHLPAADRAALQALRQEIDADYLRQDLGSLLTESTDGLDRIKRIVQDMKDFSHVGGGDVLMANLETGLDSTLNVVWNELKYKAEVVKEYAGVPDIECIPSQLNQVFMNLLVNAAHAIEARGRILLGTAYDDASVTVTISDTGSGIPAEQLGRIFEPFYTTKPVGKGTGLGLSMSYSIVQKHGGRIEVESEVGQGSTFRVVLPRLLATSMTQDEVVN